ncbi:hypothetical protein [Streptomyces colonosanans]|uniref:Uncharacterized protein n=1 Tax=Streptomyces colonosanans TaxID=1428652 RepID=A0A1S2PPE0_9ACTN|nr:hypothetical protein [Streptomyces colonosanans]OIJ95400.1 hypothetical protein BIV24_08955 [Streptomyces colonosanans]
MQTPDAFRAAHGDATTWSPADFDGYEHTLEATNPAYTEAIATGRFVFGCHAEGDQVVVDLATAEDLAQHHQTADTLQLLFGGTTGSGKTSQAAVLAAMQRLAG